MTSSRFNGTDREAQAEVRRHEALLEARGLDVTRAKLETYPQHPSAPQVGHYGNPEEPWTYFESHVAVQVHPDSLIDLGTTAAGLGCHLSRNPFKALPSGNLVMMLTRRHRDTNAPQFVRDMAAIADEVTSAGFHVVKTENEFVLWDSLPSHDAHWAAIA